MGYMIGVERRARHTRSVTATPLGGATMNEDYPTLAARPRNSAARNHGDHWPKYRLMPARP
jgi:hypothetical protein